jgi:membrane-bound metal-dependent hydrolase YbcI (DUF457 family)
MGRVHAIGGFAAGLGAGIILHKTAADDFALAGLAAGMALLPDMDQASGTASHSLGFLSLAVAKVISTLSGGHRRLTHSVTGLTAFSLIAWAAVTWRHDIAGMAVLALMITIAASSALEATKVTNGHVADVLGIAAAVIVIWLGYGLGLILAATVAGVVSHLALDAATDRGIPLLLPLSRRVLHLLPEPLAWTSGTRPENWIVAPAILAAIVVLAAWAADPALVSSGWQHAVAFAR